MFSKVFGVQMGTIVFEDEEAMLKAKEKLADKKYGDQTVAVDVPTDKNPFHKQNVSPPFPRSKSSHFTLLRYFHQLSN